MKLGIENNLLKDLGIEREMSSAQEQRMVEIIGKTIETLVLGRVLRELNDSKKAQLEKYINSGKADRVDKFIEDNVDLDRIIREEYDIYKAKLNRNKRV